MNRKVISGLIMLAVVTTLAVIVVISWIGCERGIHPGTEASPYKLSQFDLPVEDVRFKTPDGLKLAGWYVPGTNGATIILAHGIESTRLGMLPHADYLHRSGFSVLLYDSRGRGESDGDMTTLGAREPWDIKGAVDYLKARADTDPDRIGVQGTSLGAASAILAAAEIQDIKGVVAQIPFKSIKGVLYHTYPIIVGLPAFPFAPLTRLICESRLGVNFNDVDPSKVISTISPRPVFLIDELEDELFPADSVEVLYDAARKPKMLWQIHGARHCKGFETDQEGYKRRVLGFWRQVFGIPPALEPNDISFLSLGKSLKEGRKQ